MTSPSPVRTVLGAGVRHLLPDVVRDAGARRLLVVGSERAVRAAGVPAAVRGLDVEWFSGVRPNPVLEGVLAGSAVHRRVKPDLVVAVGGGSAIDTAKLVRSLPPERGAALPLLTGEAEPAPAHRRPPLVALPTTAGSGSEATRFATVYVDGVKMSLDHPAVAPEYALVDPELLRTCPARLVRSCALDALCHAVESHWSRRSTAASRRLALRALEGVLTALGGGATGDERLAALAAAATTAGQAIDLTRTTAAHAFSYRLTARFGVPHGVACALNLIWLFEHHLEHRRVRDDLSAVTAAFRRSHPGEPVPSALRALLTGAGFPDRMSGYGVRPADVADLVDAGLASGRARNNPVEVARDQAVRRLSAML
ncbi:phosphonoacetaldehyde reductase [Saccharothrix syringae]|uniref:Iron-containing alcohol dehydrogenase n=1 Tax=Saccharothrix syringae TaxID=103733 RepID=A0A5Q0GZY2_SACSY|nr:phosphonoacetaldehyde reductase [Saccharothrix syringae]QFZ19547.1 iron-containing alcohol dehydrogenase [Saccharothrix syringae]